MDERDFTDSYVPRFLNEEPVVMGGLTNPELGLCGSVGLAAGGVTTLVLSLVLGAGSLTIVLFLGATMAFGFGVAKVLRSSKSGKPRGYVASMIKIKLSRFFPSLNASGLYVEDVPLAIGRSEKKIVIRSSGNQRERN